MRFDPRCDVGLMLKGGQRREQIGRGRISAWAHHPHQALLGDVGLPVSAPKPTVALMQSRRRMRPDATSPSRNACSASVRRAALKAGSALGASDHRLAEISGQSHGVLLTGLSPFALFVVIPSSVGGGDVVVFLHAQLSP